MIRVTLTQLTTMSAIILLYWGEQWISTGHGLHPLIAGPVATLALLLPYFATWFFEDAIEEDE